MYGNGSFNRKDHKKGAAALRTGDKKMDIELIFRVAGVGMIVAVLSILLKKAERDEQALMTTLAGLVVVLLMLIDYIEQLFDAVRTAFGI